MKILVALRQWRRPRVVRKHFFRRKLAKLRKMKSEKTSLITVHPPDTTREYESRVRRSIEKNVYVPEVSDVKLALPPTYDECVEYAPPLHPPPIADRDRGRPRELLYKLQLNDIMQRQRRPSPARRQKAACVPAINYHHLMREQSRAARWAWMFGHVQWATLACLALTCLVLSFA